ncbi:MAG: D-alanyl-D-alanine carboxypeptidase family protein, partial [Caulobacteraceae bacterium]|nr:D-alanyl-D-alanine carboxypeptidase family protein [Caulobacter sp.]
DPRLLALVSGWRGPDEEAARCAAGGCDGRVRASCSAHRTGAALDLWLGDPPTSTDPASRRAKAASPAYHWLVANADRFGFVPYGFEPWHWEWTGGV